MQIEIFSDVVCPWCYIGKRHFEEALAAFPHAEEVTVTYRSFQLDPTTVNSDQPMVEVLAQKYGVDATQAGEMTDRVAKTAAAAGLDFHMDLQTPQNTFDAHRLLHFALENGKQAELQEGLMDANFVRGRKVGQRETLIEIAASVGLDAGEAAAVLDSDRYTEQVQADISLARSFGATGVPFFVFDRKFAVSGGQPPAVFTDVLEKAWADEHPLVNVVSAVDGSTDHSCTNDSCAI